MNEQDNLKKLQNRNIFEEIKHKVEQIKATKDIEKPKTESETYEDIISEVFGDD